MGFLVAVANTRFWLTISTKPQSFFLPLMSLFLLCCGDKGSTSSNRLELAAIDFTCNSNQTFQCDSRSNGKTVRLGLNKTKGLACIDLMDGPQFMRNFEVSSKTIANYDGQLAFGRFTQFIDSEGKSLEGLNLGRYETCAYIDININGRLDRGEPLYNETFDTATNILYQLDTWQSQR